MRKRGLVRSGAARLYLYALSEVLNAITQTTTLRDGSGDTYAVDALTNRYNSIDSVNLDYDAAGNLTQDKDGCKFSYDCENRIIEIRSSSDAPVAAMDYDTQGRRIRVYDAVADVTTLYYYSDHWQVLAEYDGSNSLKAYYVFGNYIDETLVMHRASADKFYLHDHLYSPMALVNSSGSVVERYEYDAYGKAAILSTNYEPRTTNLYGNPYYFTGREVDFFANGSLPLQYNRNRYLSQYMGRWFSHDLREYLDSMNLYEYAISSPIMYIDGYGLASYWLGDGDPKITHDKGSGVHGKYGPPSTNDWIAWNAWGLVAGGADRIGLNNAARHMRHYLGNTGTDLHINYRNLIDDVPYAQIVRDYEINLAIAYVEGWLQLKKFKAPIYSQAATGGRTPKEESWDWYYAVYGYSTWGKAQVERDCDKYKMNFLLKFEDKYNWDAGKVAEILFVTVPDASLGRLHQVGIAQEYVLKGETTYSVEWNRGERVGSGAIVK